MDLSTNFAIIPTAVKIDPPLLPTPSCRRRPVSTTFFVAAKKVVDTGFRRHDGVGVAQESIIRAVGITAFGVNVWYDEYE